MKKYKLYESKEKCIQVLVDSSLDLSVVGKDIQFVSVFDFIYFRLNDDDLEVNVTYINYAKNNQGIRVYENEYYNLPSRLLSVHLGKESVAVSIDSPGTTSIYSTTTYGNDQPNINKVIVLCRVVGCKEDDKIIPITHKIARKKLVLLVVNLPYTELEKCYIIYRESDDNFYMVEDGDVFDVEDMQLVGKLQETDKRV